MQTIKNSEHGIHSTFIIWWKLYTPIILNFVVCIISTVACIVLQLVSIRNLHEVVQRSLMVPRHTRVYSELVVAETPRCLVFAMLLLLMKYASKSLRLLENIFVLMNGYVFKHIQ